MATDNTTREEKIILAFTKAVKELNEANLYVDSKMKYSEDSVEVVIKADNGPIY